MRTLILISAFLVGGILSRQLPISNPRNRAAMPSEDDLLRAHTLHDLEEVKWVVTRKVSAEINSLSTFVVTEDKVKLEQQIRQSTVAGFFWFGQGEIEIGAIKIPFETTVWTDEFSGKAKSLPKLRLTSLFPTDFFITAQQFSDVYIANLRQIDGAHYMVQSTLDLRDVGRVVSLLLIPLPGEDNSIIHYLSAENPAWQSSSHFKWERQSLEQEIARTDARAKEYNQQLDQQARENGDPPPRKLSFTYQGSGSED